MPPSIPIRAILFLALTRLTSAQLSGIDAVKTSQNQYGHPQCVVANFTSTALGVANFSGQSISESQPLTWTVALSDSPDNSDQSQLLYDRNYILGVPPPTDLANSTSVHGCGLFFEGMTTFLSFLGTNNETSIGTCTDALPANCVNDIIKLAQTEGQKLQQNPGSVNLSSVCTTLQERLSASPPEFCNVVPKSAWGTILARDLTGPSAAPPLKESTCHPTTGNDYTIFLVESYRRVSAPEYNLIMPFESGVTPVMTAFFNLTSKSALAPDVQLTCLKPLPSTVGQTNDTGSNPSKSSAAGGESGIVEPMVGLMGFVGILWQLFA